MRNGTNPEPGLCTKTCGLRDFFSRETPIRRHRLRPMVFFRKFWFFSGKFSEFNCNHGNYREKIKTFT